MTNHAGATARWQLHPPDVNRQMATIAVVGGGVTGATAVSHLVRILPSGSTVVLFDQGRALGGRTSVRRVSAEDGRRIAPEAAAPDSYYAWDHGCQFFRADTTEFRTSILPDWLGAKLAVEWRGRFGRIQGTAPKEGEAAPDFFGLPTGQNSRNCPPCSTGYIVHTKALNFQDFSPDGPVYHGVGGMHSVACGLLRAASSHRQDIKVQVKVGARVAAIERVAFGVNSDRWQLLGTTGEAAFHDSKETIAAQAQNVPCSDLFFDALLVTDASASFEGWHRASAGLPEIAKSVCDKVRQRVRVPLFTALIAFEKAVPVDLDGITFEDETIWFAARSASKDSLHPQAPGEGCVKEKEEKEKERKQCLPSTCTRYTTS